MLNSYKRSEIITKYNMFEFKKGESLPYTTYCMNKKYRLFSKNTIKNHTRDYD